MMDRQDDLSEARGIVIAVVGSLSFWAVVATIAYAWTHR